MTEPVQEENPEWTRAMALVSLNRDVDALIEARLRELYPGSGRMVDRERLLLRIYLMRRLGALWESRASSLAADLAKQCGSISFAARALGVTRQRMHQIVRGA